MHFQLRQDLRELRPRKVVTVTLGHPVQANMIDC